MKAGAEPGRSAGPGGQEPPAGHERPDGLDHAERPRANKKAIGAGQEASDRERRDEAWMAMLQRVHDHASRLAGTAHPSARRPELSARRERRRLLGASGGEQEGDGKLGMAEDADGGLGGR